MLKRTPLFLILMASLLIWIAPSCKDDTNKEYELVNQWIWNVMNDYYFWYKNIPSDKTPSGAIAPEDYFASLLYTTEDKWSYITDDYTGLMSEFEGTPLTMGYGPGFGKFYNSEDVFILVLYVYKNSPAEQARLKRGDIILKIDGEQLNTSNYNDLYSKESYTVTLGSYSENGISETTRTIQMTATTLTVDPVLGDTIFNDNSGTKTGYICLSEFLDLDPFVAHVQPVLENFKTAGVTNLIVDLRYNLGGSMSSAIWLASTIAPQSAVNNQSEVVQLVYNDKLQSYMEENSSVSYPFDNEVGINLNLDKAYFLTTHNSTASASELVIVGLDPYMDVVQVGENTRGKYTGMWAIPDTETPPRHNYGLMPIVMKYANANGVTDFKDGLVPDYEVEDNPFEPYALGQSEDPQTAQALFLINGYVKSAPTSITPPIAYKPLFTPKQNIKSNLYIH